MWIGVLQRSPQCGNLRHPLTDPYYLGRFYQVEEKKKGCKLTWSLSFLGIGVPNLKVYFPSKSCIITFYYMQISKFLKKKKQKKKNANQQKLHN